MKISFFIKIIGSSHKQSVRLVSRNYSFFVRGNFTAPLYKINLAIDFSKLTKMGSYAFSGTALTSVTVPAAITEIPYGAFSGCEKLTNVKLHSGVTKIGDSAFGVTGDYYDEERKSCKSLKAIDISGVTEIGSGAFAMSGRESLVIPEAVTKIPSSAFRGCASLSEVVLHDEVTSIGENAFGMYEQRDYETGEYTYVACSSLKNIDFPAGLLVIGDYAFRSSAIEGELIEGTDINALVIPESVTKIGSGAFRNCEGFDAVVMESPVVPEFGYDVFDNGSTIYVPDEALEEYKNEYYLDYYAVLPYSMMTFTMKMSIASVETVSIDRYLYNDVTLTISADMSKVGDVMEYGIYVKRYDGYYTERFPIDAVNAETTIRCRLDSDWYQYDYEGYVASADVTVGVYMMLEEDAYIYYDEREMQFTYDQKPQVRLVDAEITSSEYGEFYLDVDYVVEGSLWINRIYKKEDGDGYLRDLDLENGDGSKTMTGSWSPYEEASVNKNVWYTYRMRNTNEEKQSNYLILTLDENGNASVKVADTL